MIFEEIKRFYEKFKGKKCVIGYSFFGREIYAFHIGSDFGKQFISTYAIHGREWITARLALKHIRLGVRHGGGWIIPLVNPDGALISQKADSMWKANARGVDLNCNFDADWGQGVSNTRIRGRENCVGDYPFSETETIALRDFTKRVRPFVTFSFHTKGEEIYWNFAGRGDERGAKLLAEITGYTPKLIFGSVGGYKDWCIQSLKIPAYTIECGADSLSHPITDIKNLKKCYKVLKKFLNEYEK